MRADTIRYVRTALELTQAQFGQLIGVAEITVNRYENNTSKPSTDTLKRMRAVLNLTDEDIAEIEENRILREAIRKKVALGVSS